MSVNPTSNVNNKQINTVDYLQEAENLSKVKQQAENEKRLKSSIEKADEKNFTPNIIANNPQLKPPDANLLKEQTDASNQEKQNITNSDIAANLNKYPEYQTLLNAPNAPSENNVINYVKQELMDKANANMSTTAVIGKALSDKIAQAANASNSLPLQQAAQSMEIKVFSENHPLFQILANALAKDLVSKGKSPSEAEALASEQALGMIKAKYGNDLSSDSAKIDKTIASLLASQLGNVQNAKSFIASLNNLVGMKDKLLAIFDQIQTTKTSEAANQKALESNQTTLKSAQELVNQALKQLGNLPISNAEKTSIKNFMLKVLGALALLRKLLAKLGIQDTQQDKKAMQSKFHSLMLQLQHEIKNIKNELRKIRHLEKKAKKFKILGKFLKVFNKIISVIMAAIILAAITFLIVTAPVTAPVSIAGLAVLLPMLAMVIASFSMSQTGTMGKMMNAFMDFGYMLVHDVLGIKVSKQTAALIFAGILVALPLIMAAGVSAVLLPLLILLLPLALLLFPLVILAATVIFVLLLSTTCLMAPLLFQLVPELLVRGGLAEKIAQSLGKKLGMSEDQINNFATFLRGSFAMGTMATGETVSSSFGKLSEDDQKTVGKKGSDIAGAGLNQGTLNRLGGYANEGAVTTFASQALNQESSPEQIKEREKEMMKMIALLQKVVAQLQKVLAALMSGADPSAIQGGIKKLENLINQNMPEFSGAPEVTPQKAQSLASLFTTNALGNITNNLPSEDALKTYLKQMQEEQRGLFEEHEEEKISRPQELMG